MADRTTEDRDLALVEELVAGDRLAGYALAASGERYPFHTHVAEGRLGNKRGRIDLYLWIDDNRKRRRIGGFLWCDTNVEHKAALQTLLVNVLPRKMSAA